MCGVADDNKRCTGCYMVWYCGQKYQAYDWAFHRQDCKDTNNQHIEVELVEKLVLGLYQRTNRAYFHDGGIPSKKHFVVKVQVPLVQLQGSGDFRPLLVYNKDKSLYAYLPREGAMPVYDLLVKSVKEEGFNGQKGFYYAIYCGKREDKSKGKKNGDPQIGIKINPLRILPVENW